MNRHFVIGYDPGGDGKHGVAALNVVDEGGRWAVTSLRIDEAQCLASAVDWLEDRCPSGVINAAGVDTLTEWSSGPSGWRAADRWLRKEYREIAQSVIAPNSIYGSMAVNGAAFLLRFADRFRDDGTMVTEAHPKACFFALQRVAYAWRANSIAMASWLHEELGLAVEEWPSPEDHGFDAALAALAALRGLNGDWTLDLHELAEGDPERVQYCGTTRYWWPRESELQAGRLVTPVR